MADHVQQQILEGVRSALVGATAAGSRVYLDRLDPLEHAALPALLIEEGAGGEDVAPATTSGLEARVYSVLVRCIVSGASDYAAAARDLGREVELVLGAPRFAVLPALPGRTRLQAVRMSLSGEGDRARGMREQLWQVNYFTRRGAPDTAH